MEEKIPDTFIDPSFEFVDPLFKFNKLNDAGTAKAQEIAKTFTENLKKLGLPENDRHASVCRTHLEIAKMFAVKAISNVKENQA